MTPDNRLRQRGSGERAPRMRLGALAWVIVGAISLPAWAELQALEEFESGKRRTFSSTGHPQANGLDAHFEYPASWVQDTRAYPSLVGSVGARNDDRLNNCTLIVNVADGPPLPKLTASEIEDILLVDFTCAVTEVSPGPVKEHEKRYLEHRPLFEKIVASIRVEGE